MIHGGVAQLVRATACHAVGRRFESGRPRKKENTHKGVFLQATGSNGEGGRGNGSFTVDGEQGLAR